jgi:hypothetical protein
MLTLRRELADHALLAEQWHSADPSRFTYSASRVVGNTHSTAWRAEPALQREVNDLFF